MSSDDTVEVYVSIQTELSVVIVGYMGIILRGMETLVGMATLSVLFCSSVNLEKSYLFLCRVDPFLERVGCKAEQTGSCKTCLSLLNGNISAKCIHSF